MTMNIQYKRSELDAVNDDHRRRIEIPYANPSLGKKIIHSYESDADEGPIPIVEKVNEQIWVAQLTAITRPGGNPSVRQVLLFQQNLRIEELEILDDSLQAHMKRERAA